MLINHKWSRLKIPRDHVSFVMTTGPGWKGLHCWDVESNHKLLWPGSDHLVTHPLQKSGQAGHGTNSKVFEKCSRSIIAYYLNLIFASSEFILHLLCGTILGLSKILCILFICAITSCQVLRGGTTSYSLLTLWNPEYRVIHVFVDWLMINQYGFY